MGRRRVWTPGKVKKLESLYRTHTNREIGDILGVTAAAVKAKLDVLNIVRSPKEREYINCKHEYTDLTSDQKKRIRRAIIRRLDACNIKGTVSCDCHSCIEGRQITKIYTVGSDAQTYFKKIEHLLEDK